LNRDVLTLLIAAVGLAGACAAPRPTPEPATAAPYAEDEFAARAAALQKTCELAAVYLGTDNARAAAVVEQARAEAREAVRRAPDAYRGAIFARALERLDGAAAALAGVDDYSPPLPDVTYERIRGDLLAAADELRPVGEPYYLKLARRYEGLGRRRVFWGPLPPAESGRSAAPPSAVPAATPSPEPAPEPAPPTEAPSTPAPGTSAPDE
jgi:hypothetical protein